MVTKCPVRRVVLVTEEYCLRRLLLECGHAQERNFPTKADAKIKAGSRVQCGKCWRGEEVKRPRLFVVTRRTREWVWIRWEAYGSPATGQRGLSRKLTVAEFRRDYIPFPNPDPLIHRDLYFRRATS